MSQLTNTGLRKALLKANVSPGSVEQIVALSIEKGDRTSTQISPNNLREALNRFGLGKEAVTIMSAAAEPASEPYLGGANVAPAQSHPHG